MATERHTTTSSHTPAHRSEPAHAPASGSGGLTAAEGLALLEEILADGMAHGRRDDPLIMKVAEAVAKLKPPAPEGKAQAKGA